MNKKTATPRNPISNALSIDRVAAEAYKEFNQGNRQLLRRDPQAYRDEERKYVEGKIRTYLSGG